MSGFEYIVIALLLGIFINSFLVVNKIEEMMDWIVAVELESQKDTDDAVDEG